MKPMKMKMIAISATLGVVAGCGLNLVPGPTNSASAAEPAKEAGVIFHDSFESGDLSKQGEAGFKWTHDNRTAVITASNRDGQPPEAATGEHALRFRYVAGQAMSEQRFELGEAYPEIWMRFALRVPTNYAHPESGKNQKLFRIWMDDYTPVFSKAGMEFRAAGDDGDSYFYMKAGHNFRDRDRAPFIDVPGDRGRWMQLVIHLKVNSAPGAEDSVFQVWRRWAGEGNFTKTHDKRDFNIDVPEDGSRGFTHGYLMGWANSAYPEDTEWLLDDFTLSTESLLPDDQ